MAMENRMIKNIKERQIDERYICIVRSIVPIVP